ncbi:MAG: hypothetical protein ACTHYY_09370, partial [Agrococcus casei]
MTVKHQSYSTLMVLHRARLSTGGRKCWRRRDRVLQSAHMEPHYEAWMPPKVIGGSARISDAQDAGIGKFKMSTGKLERPFHGVRSLTRATTAHERALQYRSKLKREQWFGGITAMRLWGLPLPRPWRLDELTRLVVPSGAYRPRSRGVQASSLIPSRLAVTVLDDLPLLRPVQAVLHAADELSNEDLLAAFDAMITSSKVYPGRHQQLEVWSAGGIGAEISAWGGGSAARRAEAALGLARPDVDSQQETRLRHVLVEGGLPEPVLQHIVTLPGGTRVLDVAWPQYGVGGEYEGDHHRSDSVQWHSDISRERSLTLAGWT